MFIWTDEAIQCVKDLWGKQSANEIAGIIGAPSRNTVCGKAHRLGLSKPFQAAKPKSRATPFRKPRVQRFREVLNTGAACDGRSSAVGEGGPAVMLDYSRPGSHSCTLMELTSETCRWPLWTDAQPERLYCGAVPAKGSVYCGCHTAIAWRSRSAA